MEQRTKLELELNTPITLQLIFDKPIIGENRYGPYYLYAFSDDDQEFSYFAPPEVHAKLSEFKAGDYVELLKTARQAGKKVVTTIEVRAVEPEPITQLVTTPQVRSNGKSASNVVATLPMNGNGNTTASVANPDALFMAMLVSFEDALRIQEKLNGMVDVNRIAITLFIARSKTGGSGLFS